MSVLRKIKKKYVIASVRSLLAWRFDPDLFVACRDAAVGILKREGIKYDFLGDRHTPAGQEPGAKIPGEGYNLHSQIKGNDDCHVSFATVSDLTEEDEAFIKEHEARLKPTLRISGVNFLPTRTIPYLVLDFTFDPKVGELADLLLERLDSRYSDWRHTMYKTPRLHCSLLGVSVADKEKLAKLLPEIRKHCHVGESTKMGQLFVWDDFHITEKQPF